MKNLLLPFSLLLSPLDAQNLNETLDARKRNFAEQAPAALIQSQNQAMQEIEDSGIYQKALKVGDTAPDFTLENATGDKIRLSDLLKKGPVVLTWYRGAWCPYCNITLAALAEAQAVIEKLGGTLVALTPELPDTNSETTGKMDLKFEVLTDLNHQVAEKYGLVFPLNPDTASRYEEKFHLSERSGKDAADRLPLPATYVIDPDGTIAYAFVDADYRRRAEPSRVVDALKALRDGADGIHLVQQFWENVWNPPYDLDLIDRLMSEDFVITSGGVDVTGRAAFKEWVREFQKKALGLRLENLEIFASADGTRVVSRWIARGRNGGVLGTPAGHQPIEFTGTAIWELRDGKLAHNWVERSAWELYQRLQPTE